MTPIPAVTRRPVTDLLHAVLDGDPPFRVTAYDGTDVGAPDATVCLHVAGEDALRYLLTAPGDLGLVRAYLTDQLTVSGIHPGDPYELFRLIKTAPTRSRPDPLALARVVAALGPRLAQPLPTPAVEAPPKWRRRLAALTPHARAAAAIAHHYDVSNRFYELVLGPSMTYTCACYPTPEASLEEAQDNKYRLVFDKLGLRPGERLLDVGCGWGGMVRYAARRGVHALGVTLSAEQAAWAQAAIEREGLASYGQVRHLDYRKAPADAYDAVSSIGLTEHIGARNYPAYFAFLASRLRTGGRLLNHCITRPLAGGDVRPEKFTDLYVFPDGELAGVGPITSAISDAGLEIQHVENLRVHYAKTLAAWCTNLAANWDECVAQAGEQRAKVWGLYMAGSRYGFESNWFELHHVLATKTSDSGDASYPLRPDWRA